MVGLAHERYCMVLVDEAEILADAVRDADLAQQVPSCPEWTLAQLVAHLGKAHRSVTALVERRSTEPMAASGSATEPATNPADSADGHAADGVAAPGSAAEHAGWLRDGARDLAAALQEAGPDAAVWTWSNEQHAGFWARRMAHETTVHRVDAEFTVGRGTAIAPELAADGLSEGLDLLSLPAARSRMPGLAELLREEPTLHFHATDEGLDEGGEWMVRGSSHGLAWEHGHRKGDVAVRGPADALLLVLLRRIPADDPRVEVLGDAALLDRWLGCTSF